MLFKIKHNLTFLGWALCLVLPHLVQAMENSDLEGQLPGLVIPSKPEDVGVQRTTYPSSEIQSSWNDLHGFTRQTISNFQKEPKDERGMLYVHSLEDIMGAEKCFTIMWNKNHPNDQRHLEGNNFHQIFTDQEFVDHYIPYVLAHRVLISGSVLAFNENPTFNLYSTFSPVNFIFEVPGECVVVTERSDARTPVTYSCAPDECSYEEYINEKVKRMKTLDALIRYPEVAGDPGNDRYYWYMNEVAVLSCAQVSEDSYRRPRIVGVLINKYSPVPGFDYGNASRNQNWIDSARAFAEKNKLPVIELNRNLKKRFSEQEAKEVVLEWFNGKTGDLNNYGLKRENFLTQEESDLLGEFHDHLKEGKKTLSPDQSEEQDQLIRLGEGLAEKHPHLRRIFEALRDGDLNYDKKDRSFSLSEKKLRAYGLSRK